LGEPIWSTGGAGGERAVTEDLEWAAGALHAAAADVASAATELARRRAALALDPVSGHADLIADLGYAARSLARRVEDQLDDTAGRLATVAAAYLAAERKARHNVGLLSLARDSVWDAARAPAWVLGSAIGIMHFMGPLGPSRGTATLPHRPPPTTSVLNRESVELALMTSNYTVLIATIDALVGLPPIEWLTRWNQRLSAAIVTAVPARSLEGVMHRLFDVEEAGQGAVRIERWTDKHGVTRRIVYVPGTQDWLNLTSNPSDLGADLALLAGGMPDAATVVLRALEADGATPGDPVMLAGHSLGGIVATALAANPQVLARFDIRAVVTAGSPVGRITLPTTVNALHLEGTRDIVPGLDGRPNPDTPTRVTVHHDARDSELADLNGEGEDIASAHHLDTYAQTARLVDEGLGPSTDAWLAAEREFLARRDDAIVTEYEP